MEFPALIPASNDFALGAREFADFQSSSGGVTTIANNDELKDRIVPLRFYLNKTQLTGLIDHYNTQRSIVDPFQVSTTTLPAYYTPTGYGWKYNKPITFEDIHEGLHIAETEIKCCPLGKRPIPGASSIIRVSFEGGIADGPGVINGIDHVISVSSEEIVEALINVTYDASVGLGGDFSPINVSLVGGDIYYPPLGPRVVLTAVHFDGTSGSTTITDSCANPLSYLIIDTLSAGGAISSERALFGQSYKTTNHATHTTYLEALVGATFALDGPYTIRLSFNQFNYFSSSDTIFSLMQVFTGGGLWGIVVESTPTRFMVEVNNTTVYSGAALPLNQWYSLTLTRNSADMTTVAINSTVLGSVYIPGAHGWRDTGAAANFRLRLGQAVSGVYRPTRAYFDEFYIAINEIATSFAPPTAPWPNA